MRETGKSTPVFCSHVLQTAQCLANRQSDHTYDLGSNQAVIFHLTKHDRQRLAFQNESVHTPSLRLNGSSGGFPFL